MDNIVIIDSEPKLNQFIKVILKKKEIALDFEGEFNLHRYGMHLCLIQIYDGNLFYIIDPVLIKNIGLMRNVFENKDICKVIYAGNSDAKLLDYRYKMKLLNVYDLQIAAKIVTGEPLALNDILSQYLDIAFIKDKKMQRSNWNIRPLKEDQIEYAALDVKYLMNAKEKLNDEVARMGLIGKLERENRKIEKIRYKEKPFPWKSIKNFRNLTDKEKVYLKYFFFARDTVARKLDFPPYFVLSNSLLIVLAKKPIRSVNGFRHLKGFSKKAYPFIKVFLDAAYNASNEIKKHK